MMLPVTQLTWLIMIAPLLGSLLVGLGGRYISDKSAHRITSLGVALAFCLSSYLAFYMFYRGLTPFHFDSYSWYLTSTYSLKMGFWIDPLAVILIQVVSFVSLLVHLYSIAYMRDDPGYKRFFSYLSFFTFAMLVLLSSHNLLQLYFGWEGVGVASYLLIGFWFTREEAASASLKAFIVNRIGDFGFLLGMALLFSYCGSLEYSTLFSSGAHLSETSVSLLPGIHCSLLTLVTFLLLIGALGKSAQIPLHVWLPDSMAGPTPVSALIHAATMVTAGIYLIARLSPLFAYSEAVLNIILFIGATTALFTGLIAMVEQDIKRVIAYSTLSQLGYMMVSLGSSAYTAAIFHLITHAFFKALLFLAAGSVILALHHEQDIRKMGQLWRHLPITYVSFFIGALALAAIPPFSGFYSKEAIITATKLSSLPAASYAYICVLSGAFVTAFYIARLFFLVFHGQSRLDPDKYAHLVNRPTFLAPIDGVLILLAIPAAALGYIIVQPMLSSSDNYFLAGSLAPFISPESKTSLNSGLLAFQSLDYLPTYLSISGVLFAWLCYTQKPNISTWFSRRCSVIHTVLLNKYGFDDFYQWFFVSGGKGLAKLLFNLDAHIIDKQGVMGSSRFISWLALWLRKLQSGHLYTYLSTMIITVSSLIIIAPLCFLNQTRLPIYYSLVVAGTVLPLITVISSSVSGVFLYGFLIACAAWFFFNFWFWIV